MQPASPESPFVRAEGPHWRGAQSIEFGVGVSLDYGLGVLQAVRIDADGDEIIARPVEHALIARLGGSLTPLHWLSFDLSLPVAMVAAGDLDADRTAAGETIRRPSGPGLGDLRAGAHARPIDGKEIGLFAGVRFWAPIGSTGAYMSDHRFRLEADLGVAGEASRFLYGATLSIAPLIFAGRDGDRAAAALAAHVKATPFLSIGLEPTVAVFTGIDKTGERPVGVLFEPLAAVRLSLGSLRVGLAAGPGLGGAPGTAAFRGVLSAAYVGGGRPEKDPYALADRDLDGIVDAKDACPDEAGPASKDPKGHGCPSPDRDGDDIGDIEDACPETPGVKHKNMQGNGCLDVDNDQTPDPIDACRNEPGQAKDGCPRRARLSGDTFRITPPIEFEGETLSAEGRAALQEIAATMRANPKFEQVSVSLGTKGARAELSDARAQQIILILSAGSLESGRFEVVLTDELPAGAVEARLIR